MNSARLTHSLAALWVLCAYGGQAGHEHPLASFGYSASGIGDCDGDGKEDVAIGLPAGRGQVFVAYSSKRYEAELIIEGRPGERLGSALAASRNLATGASISLIVGSNNRTSGPVVSMYSLAGAWQKIDTRPWGWFGGGVSETAIDGNNDEVSEWFRFQDIIGASQVNVQDGRNGKVLWRSVASGARIHCLDVGLPDRVGDAMHGVLLVSESDKKCDLVQVVDLVTGRVVNEFGVTPFDVGYMRAANIRWLSDVDGDSRLDIALARVGREGAQTQVISGASGATLWMVDGAAMEIHNFGCSMDILHDKNQDGVQDIVLGGASEKGPFAGRGVVMAVSGKSGERLWMYEGKRKEFLGRVVLEIQDADGDGLDDVVVTGHPGLSGEESVAGTVLVLAGATGNKLLTIQPPPSAGETK